MAITMILCSTGVLPIYQGIALVMGENIGTTVTSNVAALTANTQARRAAMAHTHHSHALISNRGFRSARLCSE